MHTFERRSLIKYTIYFLKHLKKSVREVRLGIERVEIECNGAFTKANFLMLSKESLGYFFVGTEIFSVSIRLVHLLPRQIRR